MKEIPNNKELIKKYEELKKNSSIRILNDEELSSVAGGSGGSNVLNKSLRICGWTYDDLYAILAWIYESYYDPNDKFDTAKYYCADFAESQIPSIFWKEYVHCSYPDFIIKPMYILWSRATDQYAGN